MRVGNAGGRLLPLLRPPRHLWLVDLRGAAADTTLAVATLAGVVNAREPRLFLVQRDDDLRWLEVTDPVTRDWLPARDNVLRALMARYATELRAVIVVDERVPESVNVATLLAAQDAGMVVTSALWDRLVSSWHPARTVTDLRGRGWSSALAAARWSWRHLRGGSNGVRLAGLEPRIGGYLRPYLIATRTWMTWLHPQRRWPEWHTGFRSEGRFLRQMLHTIRGGAYLGWFADEPRGVRLASRAGVLVLPSDLCSNLEIWSGFPAPDRLRQPPLRALPLGPMVYVSFTLGEGDNLQYDQHRMFQLWQDPARGMVPIGWTISPLLIEAAPSWAQYYYRTATENDEFIAGPSGAGYGYPSLWPADLLAVYLQRTRQMMARMDLRTVQIFDVGPGQQVADQRILQRYVREAQPGGILHGSSGRVPGWRVVAGVPTVANIGLVHHVDEALALIARAANHGERPCLLSLFVLAWRMGPSDLRHVVERLPADVVAVRPTELLQLGLRVAGG